MISYSVYRLVHLVGIFVLLVALGAALRAPRVNDSRPPDRRGRVVTAALHGLGLFVVLLGGFGLLARIGIVHGASWPGWVWAKLAIWALLGAAIAVPRLRPAWGRVVLLLVPLAGGFAAWLAIFKPF